jgi:hypothetical protein
MQPSPALNELIARAKASDPSLRGSGVSPGYCVVCSTPRYVIWFGMSPLQTVVGTSSGFILATILGLASGVVRI